MLKIYFIIKIALKKIHSKEKLSALFLSQSMKFHLNQTRKDENSIEKEKSHVKNTLKIKKKK